MKIEEIRQALLGKKLKYNRRVLLTIDECQQEDDKVLVRGNDNELLTVSLDTNIAEALATSGIHKWWGEYVYSPVCGIMGTQTLRLITPKKKGGEKYEKIIRRLC